MRLRGRTGQKSFPRARLGRRPAVWGFYAWQYSGCPIKAGTLSESGRIRPHLTLLECGIIFGGIPAGAISRKGGLIWGIPAEIFTVELVRVPGPNGPPFFRWLRPADITMEFLAASITMIRLAPAKPERCSNNAHIAYNATRYLRESDPLCI